VRVVKLSDHLISVEIDLWGRGGGWGWGFGGGGWERVGGGEFSGFRGGGVGARGREKLKHLLELGVAVAQERLRPSSGSDARLPEMADRPTHSRDERASL